MATQVERDAVLAPVLILVGIEVRQLIVQLTVHRPVRADELAQTQAEGRSVIGGAGAILQVETGRTRQVPAVIELLSGSGLRHAQTGQQCGTEKFLVHLQLLKKIRCKRNRRTCVLLEGSSFMYLDGHVLYAIPARLCAER